MISFTKFSVLGVFPTINMSPFRIPAFVVLVLLLAASQARTQEVSANPTRPSASDNAYLTANGYAELETGWSSTSGFWSLPALLKVSVHNRIELGISAYGLLQRSSGESTSLGTPGAQVKYQFDKGPGGAVAAVLHLGWPKDGPPVYTFSPVLSTVGDIISADITLGAALTDAAKQSSYSYAVAISPTLHPVLGFFLELYGSFSNGAPLHAIDAGISYPVSPRLVIDISGGAGLTKTADDWIVQVGCTSTLGRIIP